MLGIKTTSFNNFDYNDARDNRTYSSPNYSYQQYQSNSSKFQNENTSALDTNCTDNALQMKTKIGDDSRERRETSDRAYPTKNYRQVSNQVNSSNPNRSGLQRCALCDMYFPNKFIYQTHMRGSKHKKRLSGMSGPADWSMKAERAEALTRTKAFGDEFIEKVQNPPGPINSHYQGKSLENKYDASITWQAKKEKLGNPEKNIEDNLINNMEVDEPFKDSESVILNDTSTKKLDNEYKLEQSLHIQVNNKDNFDQSHEARSEEFTNDEPILQNTNQSNGIMCETCKIFCPDEYAYSTHVRGGRHRKELQYQKIFHGKKLTKSEIKAEKAQALANIPIVGEEFIIKPANAKRCKIYCELCDCELDEKGRDKHLKGKRHRQLYKENVDSSLIVESMHEHGVSWKEFLKEKKKENGKAAENHSRNPDPQKPGPCELSVQDEVSNQSNISEQNNPLKQCNIPESQKMTEQNNVIKPNMVTEQSNSSKQYEIVESQTMSMQGEILKQSNIPKQCNIPGEPNMNTQSDVPEQRNISKQCDIADQQNLREHHEFLELQKMPKQFEIPAGPTASSESASILTEKHQFNAEPSDVLSGNEVVGEEYIEKVKKPPVGCQNFRCTLCNSYFSATGIDKHCSGKPHKMIYNTKVASMDTQNPVEKKVNIERQKDCELNANLGKSFEGKYSISKSSEVVEDEEHISDSDLLKEEDRLLRNKTEYKVNFLVTERIQVGREFIEMLEKPKGRNGRFRCNLCNCCFGECDIEAHCKGKYHRMNYNSHIERSGGSEKNLEENDTTQSEPFYIDDSSFWEKEEKKKKHDFEPTISDQNSTEEDPKDESILNQENAVKCKVCQLFYPKHYSYKKHIIGSKHLEKLEDLGKFYGIQLCNLEVETGSLEDLPSVGEEFLTETVPKRGAIRVYFFCKLCESVVGEKNRDKHLSGWRHRLYYKENADRKLLAQLMNEKGMTWNEFVNEQIMSSEQSKKDTFSGTQLTEILVEPSCFADSILIEKDNSIKLKEDEKQSIEKEVSICELALKTVSLKTSICEGESKNFAKTGNIPESSQTSQSERIGGELSKYGSNFTVKAIVRVGLFAKNLLLATENTVTLVVLCEQIPTKLLLNNFYTHFLEEMKAVAQIEKRTITLAINDSTIVVHSKSNSEIVVNIVFTTPDLPKKIQSLDDFLEDEGIEYSNKPTYSLVEVRRMRWFKVILANRRSCVTILRVLRAMCQDNTAWSSLSCWVLELLVHNAIYKIEYTEVASVMRKVLEAMSAGIILPNMYDLYDPCEKYPTDASSYLTIQQRVDITSLAQNFLRCMAFGLTDKMIQPIVMYETDQAENTKRKLEDNTLPEVPKRIKASA
ncbi:uncharacterized protein isoform X3 [Rhodnius prolixus]|uniref:uncharacterized protein isoform X3 n=1 Tax=Rhodnius prolixus TaxID=13249 RepID=UPI003D18F32A